jgi:hypothetical protein
MSNELERKWKELVVAKQWQNPDICPRTEDTHDEPRTGQRMSQARFK